MPGTFRTHERKGPDPDAEPQRIVLYMPVAAMDMAEQLAYRARVETVQRYCETLLMQALTAEERRSHDANGVIGLESRSDTARTVADDPDYLEEWTAAVLDQFDSPQLLQGPEPSRPVSTDPPGVPNTPELIVEPSAVEVVLRHAGLRGHDPDAFLAAIRRDGRLQAGVGSELIQALVDLEAASRDAGLGDRRLC